ncbi:hypothetical protein ACFP3Q_12485 [Nocardioides sp. GCM10027113]|uniref:hypothetical protein n=1 Tax=unclassified Nocardioides TaxID=2615069 RepID=UPI0036229946
MAERVVLHIGTMKTGTTYLQGVLGSGILEGTNAFFAGGKFGKQTRAVQAMLGAPQNRQPQVWHDLAAEVRRSEGVAVYSQEFLSFARRPRVKELVESFGGTPVDVVLTVRDQHSAMPAQWQSFTRNRGGDAWETYVRRLERLAGGGGRGRSKAVQSFRRAQDVPGMIARWSGHPEVASVTVVTVPKAGAAPTELWDRFCAASRLEIEEPPPVAASKANESLGYASCDVLRRLNPHLDQLDKKQYKAAREVLLEVLLPLRPEEGRPELDLAGTALARGFNRAIVEAVSRDDVRLVGDTAELPVTEREAPTSIAPPDPDQVRRALEAAWGAAFPGEPAPAGGLDELGDELGRRLADRFGGAGR